MSQQNVALAQSVYDAFARGDVPTVVGAMDPNIEWIEPEAPGFPFGGVRRGPQEVIDNVFALLQTYYQEIAFLPQEFVDDGDRVLILGESRGKAKASGTSFQVDFVHVLTFRDSRWTRFQHYTNTGVIAAALN
jgi:ketosteroid isomerase-like protein